MNNKFIIKTIGEYRYVYLELMRYLVVLYFQIISLSCILFSSVVGVVVDILLFSLGRNNDDGGYCFVLAPTKMGRMRMNECPIFLLSFGSSRMS